MATVSVRYIVNDVDDAIVHRDHLGFQEVMHPAPAFACSCVAIFAWCSACCGRRTGGGQAMPDGDMPEPGGWNRFRIADRGHGRHVAQPRRTLPKHIVDGVGGKQILVEDPSGNPVELFEPTRGGSASYWPMRPSIRSRNRSA